MRFARAALWIAVFATALPAHALPQIGRRPRNGQGSTTCGTGTAPAIGEVIMPHLTYCGGRVLSQAQIVAVLWGPPDPLIPTASCSGTFQGCLDAFYRALVQSPQFDWIDEYQTTIPGPDGDAGTNQHISRATYYGSVIINPANTAAVVGELDIEAEIVSQIQAGNLPAPNLADETIYEVHFPLEVDPSDTCSQACGDFCAYHDSWHSNILNTTGIIAIIPSHMPPGYSGGRDCALCSSRTDWFANLGGSVSHETFESITDPDVGLAGGLVGCVSPIGWYDSSPLDLLSVHAEIGDMCEGLPDGTNHITDVSFPLPDGGSYTVQREWSNNFNACIGAISDAFSVSGPEGTLLDEPGSTATYTITTSPPFDAGTLVPLTLTVHGLPQDAGVSASFSPSRIDASATSTLTLSIDADAPMTAFSFAITADSGDTLAQTVLTVQAPDFTASSTDTAIALTAGGPAAVVNLDTAALNGAPRGFILSTAGASGLTLSPASGQLGTPLAVSITASAGAPSVSGTLSLNVTSAGVLHSVPLQLTLTGDDVSLSAPAGLQIAQGGSADFTVTTTTRSGTPQKLTLFAINLPENATASISPLQINSGDPAHVSLTIPDDQPLSPIAITIVAQGSIGQFTVNVPLTVVTKSGCTQVDPGLLLLLAPGLFALRRRRL